MSDTESDIEDLFKKFGPLTEINLPIGEYLNNYESFIIITLE